MTGQEWVTPLYLTFGAKHIQLFVRRLTLEMGSWLWVRKNPKQMLDFFGYFNPMITHRHHRVLRQHLPLFDFLLAAADNWQNWIPLPHQRAELTRQAIEEWFAGPAEHGAR